MKNRREKTPGRNRTFRADVHRYVDETGATVSYERYEAEMPLSCFDHDKKFKAACKACETFGKNLACPPFSPTFQGYLGNFERAKVICLRLPQKCFNHIAPEERGRACFRKGGELLTGELLQFRQKGFRIAGSGPCLACKKCNAAAGHKRCRKPKERIYSLESLGVNLLSLVNHCFNIDLEWSTADHSADFVCAIGAVFFAGKT